jgi:hypothetical protein
MFELSWHLPAIAALAKPRGETAKVCQQHYAEAKRFPSGENVTTVTHPVCSRLPKMTPPDSASQTQTLLSQDPETMRLPFGENPTDATAPLCP